MVQSHILRRGPSPARERAEEVFRPPPRTLPSQPPPQPSGRGMKSQPGQGAENRRKAFVKLANDRMVRAIDAITLLGNLSNTKNYKFTERDVVAMETALAETIKQTFIHFRSPRDAKPTFSLPEDEEGDAA